MSQQTVKKSPGRVPPDDAFYERYSPHHELPLSAVSSFVLHALGLGLMIAVVSLTAYWLSGQNQPLPSEVVILDLPGGGGGNPNGIGSGPGSGVTGNEVPIDDTTPPDKPIVIDPTTRPDLKEAQPNPIEIEPKDNSTRPVPDYSGQAQAIAGLGKKIRDQLAAGIAAGKGQGGKGQGGGAGEGVGTGQGDGAGPGKGSASITQKRLLRWTMVFNTRNGGDYARQLQGLGAILAIPDPSNPENYLVIRDLSQRPVQPKAEDLAEIKSIYWIDDKPSSMQSLAQAFGINPVPPHIVAFFPRELEKQLLDLELAYKGLKEEQIEETKFDIRKRGDGYVPVVAFQSRKGGR